MADIAWTAYALAMFTPDQLAAAARGEENVPDDGSLRPIPPQPPPIGAGFGVPTNRVTIDGVSYDPNTPQQLKIIMAAGWRFEAGRWIAPGSLGTVATPDGVMSTAGGAGAGPGRGLASVVSATIIAGASVLGNIVPVAPAVLLPSFVGGRVGVVRMGGGMRPQSGGSPDRVRFGDPSVLPVVRWEQAGGGGGGRSW